MQTVDQKYKQLLQEILTFGVETENRTGVNTIAIPSAYFCHDMSEGFPILAGKKVSFHTSKVELEGFLKGITSKKWYQERKCTIWNEWADPRKAPYGTDEASKQKMESVDSLGRFYAFQWRHFGGDDQGFQGGGLTTDDHCDGFDQIQSLLDAIQYTPDSRRMIVTAWNPNDLNKTALPSCHFSFQVIIHGEYMHLNWNQRSVDTFLGLPYNICFYGLLLTLLAKLYGYTPGQITGFLGDTHLYKNHLDQVKEYMDREPCLDKVSVIIPESFNDLLESNWKGIKLEGYDPMPAIKAPIAV